MKALLTILFATIWLAYVPMFVANAQETKTDDVFEDEQAPAMPEAVDEFVMDEGGDVPPVPTTTAEAPPAAPAPKAEPKALKQAKQEPAPKAEKAPAPVKARKTASSGGFRNLKGDCPMHADASDASAVLTTLKGPKKIWTEKHSDGWVKGFRKNGEGYLSTECFE